MSKEVVKRNAALRNQISEKESIRAQLKAKLDELGSPEGAFQQQENMLAQLRKQKEDLQADVALGETSKQSDIEKMDREIAVAEASVTNYWQTVNGLNRRLKEVESEVSNHKSDFSLLVEQDLIAEGERLMAEYLGYARKLLSTFKQLQALTVIHDSRYPNRQKMRQGGEERFLSIPVFMPDAAGEARDASMSDGPEWKPAKDVRHGGVSQKDVELEESRLRSIGIEI